MDNLKLHEGIDELKSSALKGEENIKIIANHDLFLNNGLLY